jgi:hypothetical protein
MASVPVARRSNRPAQIQHDGGLVVGRYVPTPLRQPMTPRQARASVTACGVNVCPCFSEFEFFAGHRVILALVSRRAVEDGAQSIDPGLR